MAYEYGIESMNDGFGSEWSTTRWNGWSFIAKEDNIKIKGLRVLLPVEITGDAYLYEYDTNKELAKVTITSIPGQWSSGFFESPVLLEKEKKYLIFTYSQGKIYYYSNALSKTNFNSKIGYVSGCYGPTKPPKTTEEQLLYPHIDIIINSPEERWLIKVGSEVFTKNDVGLVSLGDISITADLFLQKGFTSKPTSDDLIGFENPEVLLWNNSEDNVPGLTATVKAIPKNNQQIITNAIDLTHSSITGIESAIADCDGELVIAVSFDNKQTWKAWNGEEWSLLSDEFSGMNKETLESITFEQWNLVYSGATSMYLKVSFLDATQVIRTIKIDFAN